MRRTLYLILASGLIGLGSVSCSTFSEDCFSGKECPVGFGNGGSSSTTTTTTSTVSSTSTGVIPGCDGELMDGMTGAENKGLISDMCGVFVQADATETPGKGTQARPYTSLQTAIAKADGRNVYVCTSAPIVEAVTIQLPVSVYGGFDCKAGWKYDKATRSQVEAPADAIAVTILKDGVSLNNLAIKSDKATTAGKSAIAVLASGAVAGLTNCVIEAGPGAAGEDGPAGGPITGDVVDSAAAGTTGASGQNACSDNDGVPGLDTNILGGVGPTTTCGIDSSVGGDGGSGKVTVGTAGTAGLTGTVAGAPGIGEPAVGAWSCGANGNGAGGDSPLDGDFGTAGKGKGTLTTDGYLGVAGGTGVNGQPGQGGGGGGGTKGGLICSGALSGAGASGGSGGSGGCGGNAGRGGTAGGSSIAVASVNSTVTLTDCALKSGKGGKGGKGGELQPGGAGGDGGKGGMGVGGSKAACDGGKGGQGANGGTGGGGQGGHSLTIAYLGTPVSKVGKMDMAPGTFGVGGPGGNSSKEGNAGDDGKAMPELIFP